MSCLSDCGRGGRKNGDVDGMRSICEPSSSSNSTVHGVCKEVCQSSNENFRFNVVESSLSTSESPVDSPESLPTDMGENGRVEIGEVDSCWEEISKFGFCHCRTDVPQQSSQNACYGKEK